MMKAVVIDFETTGVDPKIARPWEVGAAIVDPEAWEIESTFETRIWGEDYPSLSPEVKRVCRVSEDKIEGCTPGVGLATLSEFVKRVGDDGILIAYNVAYDRTIWESEAARQGLHVPSLGWACALSDINYPGQYRCKQLSHLALDHGIRVNPEDLHGALGDVKLTVELLKAGEYTLPDMLEYRDAEWIYLRAKVPPPWEDNGRGKNAARAAGYSYETNSFWGENAPKFSKSWVKRVKAHLFQEEQMTEVPFKRERISP